MSFKHEPECEYIPQEVDQSEETLIVASKFWNSGGMCKDSSRDEQVRCWYRWQCFRSSVPMLSGMLFVCIVVRLSVMTKDATSTGGVQEVLNKQLELLSTYTSVKKQCQLRAPSDLDRIRRDNSGVHGASNSNAYRYFKKRRLSQYESAVAAYPSSPATQGGIYHSGAVFGDSWINLVGNSKLTNLRFRCI
jgi:hypothetical protein